MPESSVTSSVTAHYDASIPGLGPEPSHVRPPPPQVIDLAKDFKVPGAEQEGFYYLRDVVDADVLVAAIAKLKETGGKVCRPKGRECTAQGSN